MVLLMGSVIAWVNKPVQLTVFDNARVGAGTHGGSLRQGWHAYARIH